MGKRNNDLLNILSNLELPILANYDDNDGIPDTTIVARLKCESCNTEVISNNVLMPLCPVCSNTMKKDSETRALDRSDIEEMKFLGKCEACDSNYVSTANTINEMQNKHFNCLICAEEIIVSDDSDTNDDNKTTTTTDISTTKDDSSSDNSGDASNPADTTEADKELEEVLKKMGLHDSSNTNNDDSKTDNTTSNKVAASEDDDDDNSPEDDTEEEENDDSEDDKDESDAALAVFRASLKTAKKTSVIASDGYDKWYLFVDDSPLAIASISNADDSIKRVFRSRDFALAFDNAVKADNGLNEQLVKDFGFTPIDVKVHLDDVTKQMVNDEIENKTKELKEKLASFSSLYDQSLGVAAVGITKGIYTNGNSFRNNLVAKLTAHNMREPEHFVDSFLAKELPELMKNTIVVANELMTKSPEVLEATAEMVKTAEPRAIIKSTSKSNVVPISVTSSAATLSDLEKSVNNNLSDKSKAPLAGSILSGIKRRV